MEVRLFSVGGHDYVFRFGVLRKESEKQNQTSSSQTVCPDEYEPVKSRKGSGLGKKTRGAKRVNVVTPANKYAYSRRSISSNLGLERYKKIMAKISELLEFISVKPEHSKYVAERINNAGVFPDFELKSHMLNMFARISDGTSFEDLEGKLWTLISEGWGQDTTIRKQEVK